ncbi:hypothetical protein KJ855_02005, partial [Patescibacteria group bacterium]|nr:hypothetical protein [Patescibacteria group bacterium]
MEMNGVENKNRGVRVLDNSEYNKEIEASWRRAFYFLLGPKTDVLIINAIDDAKWRYVPEEITTSKSPIIFYGHESENTLLRKKHPLAPYFFQKNGVYVNIPFKIENVINSYQKIHEGKKIENPAAKLWAKKQTTENLISCLLHDLKPSKMNDHEHTNRLLIVAKQHFDISGTPENVYEELEILSNQEHKKGSREPISQSTLPGIFCDIDGTLLIDQKLNTNLWTKLEEHSQQKAVTLWTG